jgi:hypothetical protein
MSDVRLPRAAVHPGDPWRRPGSWKVVDQRRKHGGDGCARLQPIVLAIAEVVNDVTLQGHQIWAKHPSTTATMSTRRPAS